MYGTHSLWNACRHEYPSDAREVVARNVNDPSLPPQFVRWDGDKHYWIDREGRIIYFTFTHWLQLP